MSTKTFWVALLAVLATAALLRGMMWLWYLPSSPNDTQAYIVLAHQIATGDFTTYDGGRTPIYPVFLLATGLNDQVVWLLQSLLGVAISGMLFVLVWQRTQRIGWASLAGAFHALNLNQVLFERVLVTETLATFLLLASLAAAFALRRNPQPTSLSYAWLGLLVATASLTRPLFVALIPLYLGYLVVTGSHGVSWATTARRGTAYLLPLFLTLGGWCTFNLLKVGYFGPTTLTGYNLTNHSGQFIEDAPDQYATIRDIYLRFRAERIAGTGSHVMTIWDAAPEMQRVTGMSFTLLSRELTRMSVDLITRHPIQYLESAGRSAIGFWVPATYDWGAATSPVIGERFRTLWRIERFPILAMSVLFLLAGAAAILRRPSSVGWDEALAIAIVVVGCVVQALMEQGENPRYAIPFEPLVIYVATVFASAPLANRLTRTRIVKGLDPMVRHEHRILNHADHAPNA